MDPIPSTTFLFDSQRTGRMPYSKGKRKQPELVWRFVLPSYPPKGPESSPAFDDQGNIYFGCHDGCFYSLDREGRLRWMFKTDAKIYSSPAIFKERVVFCSGDGHCFCFDLKGTVKWVYYAADFFVKINNALSRKIALARTWFSTRDAVRQRTWKTKCWTSPNISSSGVVYITCYGIGLHALRIEDGEPLWLYDLGQPRHHLSGVALNENEDLFVASQQKRLHSVSPAGKRRWSIKVRSGYDAWGNPSVDCENQLVFFPLSCQEKKGCIATYDYNGNPKWICEIIGGLRGSVAIAAQDFVLAAGLNGFLYFIDKRKGYVAQSVKLASEERGLWTTPALDKEGNIFITTKDSRQSGSLWCLNCTGQIEWRLEIGKALSTPVIDSQARVFVGSWNGDFLCFQT